MAGSIVSFSTRRTPWSQLGTDISDCRSSGEALAKAGLDWLVRQTRVQSLELQPVYAEGFKLNIRNSDDAPLGIVKDRYQLVQNSEAFAFMDSLVDEGVQFCQAGQFQGGRKVWILAKLPERYIIAGDAVSPYVVFINSHDGSTGIKIAMTPVRVICCNMLNLALKRANRTWSAMHTGKITWKLKEAKHTLVHAHAYMDDLGREIDELSRKKISEAQIIHLTQQLFPESEKMTDTQKKNTAAMKADFLERYRNAPDLLNLPNNGYRFINAASDYATHAKPLRKRSNYQEALFAKIVDGHAFVDKAYELVKAA